MVFKQTKRIGSALILVVMLMSILGIIGVLFLMAARVDELSTKSIVQEKDLDAAVESIVAKLAAELVLDTPGITDPSKYYDYPDSNNLWLASLEPYDQDGNPATTTDIYWDQISDPTGYLRSKFGATAVQDISVRARKADGTYRNFLPDHSLIELDSNRDLLEQSADADGDGVADSKWIELEDLSSGTGKNIYAAVRVIDNGGMLNVNTAYWFNSASANSNDIDGSSQFQINLAELSRRGANGLPQAAADKLQDLRCGPDESPLDFNRYRDSVVRRLEDPCGFYRPFDISDELELRYRYLVNQDEIDARIEEVWDDCFQSPNIMTPITPTSTTDLDGWFKRASVPSDPCYSYRHLGTIYNADRIINPNRIIDPNGQRMININTADIDGLYRGFEKVLDVTQPSVKKIAAQLAVNIVDYRDDNNDVTVFTKDGVDYYGFEAQPFISEIAANIDPINPTDPNNNAFALELYNPFNISIPLNGFTISISSGDAIPLSGTINAGGFYVITNNASHFSGADREDTSLTFSGNYVDIQPPPSGDGFYEDWDNYNITLKRTVGSPSVDIVLDFQDTVHDDFAQGSSFHRERDIRNWHVVYDTMNTEAGSLGMDNSAVIDANNYNLDIANKPFATVGDVVRPLIIGPDTNPNNIIGRQLASAGGEDDVRIDLASNHPDFRDIQQIFNYITVFDPTSDGIDNDGDGMIDNSGEKKIYGRININTAPAYVLAQLPWMQYKDSTPLDRANAICDYRDMDALGFKSIGELMQVNEIRTLGSDGDDNLFSAAVPNKGPDITDDTAQDDFEERDLIFSRISNLVTVRSDVFTAYILVRLGADGPQKRMVAILDRSNVSRDSYKVKIIALHPVADPR